MRVRTKREYIVVSVGGSLIVPQGIDTSFLKNLRSLVLEKTQEGSSFYIIAGGGRLARNYQEAATEIRGEDTLEREDMDWLGIHSTRLNAHLLRTIFIEEAQARIVKNPTHRLRGRESVVIGAGWKPGWSTDYCAVMAAKTLGAKKLVNLSNIDYVYTADPRKNPDATKIEKIDWDSFRKLIPSEWDPGLSAPFDPVAAREAEALGLEVAIINGEKLQEFKNYLNGEPFVGTVIS
ncbi:UMP kinase [Patescibacteria group bacterium]|nr:UMP kinase [Patescibacteria group bacterium]